MRIRKSFVIGKSTIRGVQGPYHSFRRRRIIPRSSVSCVNVSKVRAVSVFIHAALYRIQGSLHTGCINADRLTESIIVLICRGKAFSVRERSIPCCAVLSPSFVSSPFVRGHRYISPTRDLGTRLGSAVKMGHFRVVFCPSSVTENKSSCGC